MPNSAADRAPGRVADATTAGLLSDIRDLLGEILNRLPEPDAASHMATEPPKMASDDPPSPTPVTGN